jgi:uncharacterized DUF497 family protein
MKSGLCTYIILLDKEFNCTYTLVVETEWDPAKALENKRIHGIDLAVAVGVLEDENALTIEDLDAEDEQRFRTLGMDGLGRLLVVVYTYRGEKIRLISAWKASRKQEKQYAKKRR